MTLVRHSLSRDDWDLTRKGLLGQLTQLKLTVGGVEASILHCERMMRRFPVAVTEGVLPDEGTVPDAECPDAKY